MQLLDIDLLIHIPSSKLYSTTSCVQTQLSHEDKGSGNQDQILGLAEVLKLVIEGLQIGQC